MAAPKPPMALQEAVLLCRHMDHWPERVYVKDSSHKFVYLNASAQLAMLNYSGRESDSWLGLRDVDLFPDEVAQSAMEDEKTILSHPGPMAHSIVREGIEIWKKTGAVRLVSTRKTGVVDNKGSTVGILGITRELSLSEQAEYLTNAAGTKAQKVAEDHVGNGPKAPGGIWKADIIRTKTSSTFANVYLDDTLDQLHPGIDNFARIQQVFEADRPQVVSFLRAILRGEAGDCFEVEYRVRRPSGNYEWMHASAYLLQLKRRLAKVKSKSRSDRDALIAIAIHKKIPAPSPEKLLSRAFQNSFPGYIFVKDSDFRFRFANRSLLEYLGMEFKDVVNKTDEELGFPANECRIFRAGDVEIQSGKTDSYISLEETLTGKGSKKSNSLITVKVPIDAGTFEPGRTNRKARYILGFSFVMSKAWTDIRDWKRIGQAIWQHSPAAMYLKDISGRYQQANPEFLRIVGVENEEGILNRTASDVFSRMAKDNIAKMLEQDHQALEKGIAGPDGQVLELPDGTRQLRLTTKFRLVDESGLPWRILGISRDMSWLQYTQIDDNFSVNEEVRYKLTQVRGEYETVIMFCDIRNFSHATSTLTQHEPVLVELTQRLYKILVSEAEDAGFEFRFLGDGGMIVDIVRGTSSPKRMSDAALKMCKAAMNIKKQWDKSRREWHEKHPQILIRKYSLSLGMGIHAGKAYGGVLRGKSCGEFNVFGDPVVLAQRLESGAGKEGDQILVSHVIYELLKDYSLSGIRLNFGDRNVYLTKERGGEVFAYPLLGWVSS